MPVSKTRKQKKRKKESDGSLSVPFSALSPEHPLECCVINSNWRDAHMANVIIARKTPNGLTVVGFLVDTWGLGLKDVFVHKGISPMTLDQLLVYAAGEHEMVFCSLMLAQELLYGGLVWARQNGFRTPAEVIRSLKILPAPLDELSMSHFGTEDGKPLIIF